MAGKLQNDDFQTSTQAGGIANLTDDGKIYITANGINQTLSAAITSNALGSSAPTVLSNSAVNSYSMISMAGNTIIRHTATGGCTYQLPTAVVGTKFFFINESTNPTGATVITIDGTNNKIDFYTTTAKVATLASATYNHGSSGVSGTLGTQIKTQMDSADGVGTYTITFDYTNKIYTATRSTGTFYFLFATGSNVGVTSRFVMGFLGVDGSAALSQVGFSLLNEVRIQPYSGQQIYWRNQLAINPGYVAIRRRGVTVSITAVTTTTWEVEQVTGTDHLKNTTIGDTRQVAIVGKDVWVTKATGGTARSHIAGFTLNGFGYICDGTTGSNSNEVNQYNDSANTWATKATGGSARAYLSGFAFNSYGYICDGYIAGNSNEVNQYNDAANTWATMATAGTARNGVAGFAFNGYGYNFGGLVVSTKYNEVNQYNDSANTWATMATCGTARCYLAGFSLNGYGYACDGYDNASTYYNEVNQYNDSANTWTTKALGGTSRQSPTSFSLNGYGYICDGNTTAVSNEVNQYSDSYNTWTTKALAGTARNGVGSFALNGYGYVCDGITGSVTNEVNQYN